MEKEKNFSEKERNMIFKRMTCFFKPNNNHVKFTYRGDQTLEILKSRPFDIKTEIDALAFKLALIQNVVDSVVLNDELKKPLFIKIGNDIIIDNIDFQKSVDSFGSLIMGGASGDSTNTSTITDTNS